MTSTLARLVRFGLVALPLALTIPAHADEVEDVLTEALELYRDGDIAGAKESTTYALQLMQQMKGEQMAALLPEPPQGWEGQEPESSSGGMGLFGGNTAARSYTRDGETVTVTFIADSPMIAQMAGLFSNPAIMGSQGKVTRINRQTAVIGEDQIQMLVDNRIMVTVDGGTADDRLAYAEAIDVKALRDLE
ncbi:hypothetical protein [Futiania mangrovi]|uniref:Type IV pilus biogenesis protein PilP n=1 Tax=Futiania mangrovi TaxID=2959716 RepID=A0A9J6PB35_9PROT|nr:hypothetical protein [Futiania mangrovii]MCP1335665.1 hypothetical protein [Futiania mangrovii]